MTLSSIFRSAIKYKPSSAAANLFAASVSGAASPLIREINDAELLGKKNKTCDLSKLPVFPNRLRPKSEEEQSVALGLRIFDISHRPKNFSKGPSNLKECNVLIKRCIMGARNIAAAGEGSDRRYMKEALTIFMSMKRWGFPLEEETYGPFLTYLIEKRMVDDYYNFRAVIQDENPCSGASLGYYDMMFWIRLNDDKTIQRIIDTYVSCSNRVFKRFLRVSFEHLLLALCASGRTKEFVQLLEGMDITKFSSLAVVECVLKCLGELLMESLAEKVFLEFKACDCAAGNTSILICSYVLGIPNLTVVDVISKFKNMHRELEVTPSSVSYEKLIIHCCDSLKVHVALELLDEMIELGLTCSSETLHSILQAIDIVNRRVQMDQIFSAIYRSDLEPNSKTFRSSINLCVKKKDDYENAYDLDNMNDAKMAETNMSPGLKVLKEMKKAAETEEDRFIKFMKLVQ